MFPLAIALLLAAAEPAPAAAAAPVHNEIVVTGRSLAGLKEDLDRCIETACPARQDIIASVRYAEGLFRSARCQDSRRVLQQAITRDKHAGHDDPYAVAALYEATATVARHEGDQAVVASAVDARLRLFRETMQPDSADLLRAEMDRADLVYQREGPLRGLTLYREVEAHARSAGLTALAAGALLRQAQAVQATGNPAGARRILDGVIAQGGAVPIGYRLAAFALKTRRPHARGDTAAVDALRAELARAPQSKPLLIYAPLPPKPADEVDLDYFNTTDRVSQGTSFYGIHWADIGYTIRPDGSVDTPEVLRGNLDKTSAGEIITSIGRRLYAAFATGNGDQYHVERWTLTADYATPQGSLIRRRLTNPHYEVLDVTSEPNRQPPAPST